MIKIKYCLLLLIFAISFLVKADLRPVYLTIEISAPKTKFTTTELVQINVTLKMELQIDIQYSFQAINRKD